jgi:hypothetical protein
MQTTVEREKPSELTISVDLGFVSITVKGENKDELQRLLETGIELTRTNSDRLVELANNSSLSNFVAPRNITVQPSHIPKDDEISQGPNGLKEVVQVFENGSIKFIAQKVFNLKAYEAVAIVMYALDKPLGPSELATIVTGAWKAVTKDSISVYFSRELKSKVTRNSDGKYLLNGAGKNWVEVELREKCRE